LGSERTRDEEAANVSGVKSIKPTHKDMKSRKGKQNRMTQISDLGYQMDYGADLH
jgi:hypothetical protein